MTTPHRVQDKNGKNLFVVIFCVLPVKMYDVFPTDRLRAMNHHCFRVSIRRRSQKKPLNAHLTPAVTIFYPIGFFIAK